MGIFGIFLEPALQITVEGGPHPLLKLPAFVNRNARLTALHEHVRPFVLDAEILSGLDRHRGGLVFPEVPGPFDKPHSTGFRGHLQLYSAELPVTFHLSLPWGRSMCA